jgi:hypothetical protein
MTPQERQQVNELFERLARLESAPRDAEAERAIAEGLARAPHALYPLVQTMLVQDEALKRADARIRELSGADDGPRDSGGFLDNMRAALIGRPTHTSVPSVRAASPSETDPRWNRGGVLPQAAAPAAAAPSQGSSFLGTAAASAAGVIGGALLLNSISSMFGHHGSSAFAGDAPAAASPWDNSASGSDLARDAGLNDVEQGSGGSSEGTGLFGGDADDAGLSDLGNDGGGDFGGGDSA